jgi:serine protease inhibitor
LDLYGRLKSTNGNLFFSPFSISGCLAMTYAGARGNTEMQMAQALHFGTNQVQSAFGELDQMLNQRRAGIELSVANGLWVQKGQPFLPAFLKITREQFGAEANQIDFGTEADSARANINSWVSGKTKGKIKDAIPPGMLGRDSRLILVNAIYFKGAWKTQFNPMNTRNSAFHLNAEQSVECPMMFCTEKFRYAYQDSPHLSCQVLELPYVGKDVSLIAILPLEWDGLTELENNLTETNLSTLLALLQETKIGVSLPKFRLQTEFSLNNMLSDLGMHDAFNTNADFSGLDGTKRLYVSSVRHQAFVEVDEEGTTAAAVTTTHTAAKAKPRDFRADHPFLFLIRDNRSGSILFLGRLADPTK